MGFLNLFKKKKQEPIEVSKNNIPKWISEQEQEIKEKKKDFVNEVIKRTKTLIQELEQYLKEAKNIDLENERAQPKLKLIRKQNLNEFLYKTEKIISELKELNKENIINDLNSKLSKFKKRTHMNFQKSTALLTKNTGRKIEAIPKSINKFTTDLEKIIKQNQDTINKSNIIHFVKQKLQQINNINNKISELNKEISDYENKISELNKKTNRKKQKIQEIQNSDKYKEQLRKKQELEEKKQELKNQTYELKQLIDFKTLQKFFHSFEKEMNLLKQYKNNFQEEFFQNQNSLIELLRESKLFNTKISQKIRSINQLSQQINNIKIQHTGIDPIKDEISNLEPQINHLNNEKQKPKKRINKLTTEHKSILNFIEQELNKINVNLKS